MAEVSISLLAAARADLCREVEAIGASGAGSLHLDVMDGRFVPRRWMAHGTLAALRDLQGPKLPFDIHLMVADVEAELGRCLQCAPRMVLFHIETQPPDCTKALLAAIKRRGVRAGLALAPGTPLEALAAAAPLLDEVLLMTCAPGQAGAGFQPASFGRIAAARSLLGGRAVLSVDGGLDETLALRCIEVGADKVILGRAYFKDEDPAALIGSICRA